jgi:hypothetical protein
MLIACQNNTFYGGLPNELPNHEGIPVVLPTGTGGAGAGGGTTTTTTTTTTGPAGPAESLCDCASAFTLAGTTACVMCSNTMCLAAYDTCQAGDCSVAVNCLVACAAGDGTCIAGCISQNPDYANLMSCLYLMGCANSCGVATPLQCPLPDGGTDGGTDAGDG